MNNTSLFSHKFFLRLLLGIISVAAIFILAACSFDSPMMNAPSGQIDERLLGNWVNLGGDTIKISKIDNFHYLIEKDKSKFSAYQSDIGNERFITIQGGVKYLFFHYTVEAGGKKLVGKNVGDNLLNETSDTKTIRKVIENSLSNPKLYDSGELILKKTDAGQQTAVTNTANVAENQAKISKSGLFLSDDTQIYYEIYGAEKAGTPLFVLHGGPGFDHQYFLSNSAFTDLAKNRPVVFYDQRGTGKSAKLKAGQTATLKNGLEDLLRLTKFLGYKKIDLAGHSWGGFQAMTYALSFPEQISHLIIIDSMSENFDDYEKYEKFEAEYPKEYEAMGNKRMEGLLKGDAKAMRASIVEYMKMLLHSPQNRDSFIAGSDKFTYDSNVNRMVVASAEGIDLTENLKKLDVPTLILHGRFDANISVESAEEIHNTIPNSQLVIFEQSGHLPFYEEKEKFVKTVETFLLK